jgi:GNAT superfamily N-acetyltransferase
VGKTPIRIVVDRSKDGLGGRHYVSLHDDARFWVTENERRLNKRTLDRCDVLVIESLGAARYNAPELAAIRAFVRRGGGLLLASCSGTFERRSGRPMSDSSAQQVADVFRVTFAGTDQAAGRMRFDEHLRLGYRRPALSVVSNAPFKGLRRDEIVVRCAGPLKLPKGARAVMRHRRTGEPVAASLRYGKGRVFVSNVEGIGEPACVIGRRIIEWLTPARRTTNKLPERLAPPARTMRRGDIELRSRGVSPTQVKRIAGVAVAVREQLMKVFGRAQPKRWLITVVPGCGGRRDWEWRIGAGLTYVGAETGRASLVYELAYAYAIYQLRHREVASPLWQSLDMDTLTHHLALRTLGEMGFAQESEQWRSIVESWPDGDRDPRTVDLGRWRNESGPSPAMWLWRALEEEAGSSLIHRLLKPQMKEFPWKKFPHWDVFGELDIMIYYLSRAAKRDLFPWFAERGCTVHPLPLVATSDKSFMPRCLATVRRRFKDAALPVSERFDAARVLMRARIHKRVRLGVEAKRLSSKDEGTRLIAAMRLVRARDERGKAALRRIARKSKDDAHAATAAVMLTEAGDKSVAARLVELSRRADSRFQLDAAAALRRVGRRIARPAQIVADRHIPLGPDAVGMTYHADVDGYLGGSVDSLIDVDCWPGGVTVPRHWVAWVHTAPKWRRKGFSRELLFATLADRYNKQGLVSGLDTGTTNVAHTLYRAAGFVDIVVWYTWHRTTERGVKAPKVKNVRVRAGNGRDARLICDLANSVYKDCLWFRRERPREWSREVVCAVAERTGKAAKKEGRLAGHILGWLGEPDRKGKRKMQIVQMCVAPGKGAQATARALGARFCALSAQRGASRISAWAIPEDEAVKCGLMEAGYSTKKDGGVDLWRINDLPGLLRHLTPLFESRLKKKKRNDWCGTVAIRGETHRAALRLSAGKVSVLSQIPKRPDIGIDADDETVTLLVAGRQTAFEAMLQVRLRITPKANRDVTTLIEALFPKTNVYMS